MYSTLRPKRLLSLRVTIILFVMVRIALWVSSLTVHQKSFSRLRVRSAEAFASHTHFKRQSAHAADEGRDGTQPTTTTGVYGGVGVVSAFGGDTRGGGCGGGATGASGPPFLHRAQRWLFSEKCNFF